MRERRRFGVVGIAAVTGALLGASCRAAFADPPPIDGAAESPPASPAVPAAEPLRFRRAFVPADQIQAWPFGTESYLPVDGREFEALVRKADTATDDMALPEGAELLECRVAAKFSGEADVLGVGEIDVKRRANDGRLVKLSPFNLAAFNAKWKQTGEGARLGASPSARTMLWVDRSDTLQFEFRAQLQREAADAWAVAFDVPNCQANSLELSLPDVYSVQQGDYTVEAGQSANGIRRWKLHFVGGRIRARFAKVRDTAIVLSGGVRIESAYDFTERGIELTSQLRIDALRGPIDQILLDLDPGLTLVDARLPDRQITWVAAPPAGATAAQRYVLDFERPLEGVGRTLFLKAVAPLVVGRSHRLPTFRVADLHWQQATLTLSIPAPLEIMRITPIEGLFTNPVPLAGSRPGEAVELQCFTPAGGAELVIERRNKPIDVVSVTKYLVLNDEIVVEMQAELRVDVGNRFTLEAELPARWVIDSLVTSPATAPADWSLSDAPNRRRLLSLRPPQPLAPDRPLRVTVVGRLKHHNIGDRITRDQLRFLSFREADDRRGLTALRAEESLQLRLPEDAPTTLPNPERLDPLRRELLGGFTADYLVSSADPWEFPVGRRNLDVSADISVLAAVETGGLNEQYRFRVKNASSRPLERLRIRFSPAKDGALQWTLGDARRGQFTAVRLPITVEDDSLAAKDEVWEIEFRKPSTGDVELAAERVSSAASSTPISTASVVDAKAQTGTVEVAADSALPLRIVNRTAIPLPAAPTQGDQRRTRGIFRFQPEQVSPKEPAPLTVIRSASTPATLPTALVWAVFYDTKYDSQRHLTHRATMYVQALSGGRCRIVPEESAEITAVRVNGEAVAEFTPHEAMIPAAEQSGVYRIEVDYRSRDNAAGRLRLIELPVLLIDAPVLFTSRDVALPIAFDAPADAGLKSLNYARAGDWLRRLCGPLAPSRPKWNSVRWGERAAAEQVAPRAAQHDPRFADEVALVGIAVGTAVREAAEAKRTPRWSDVWAKTAEAYRAASLRPLRIDAAAIRRLGIAPATTLEALSSDLDDQSMGEQTLARAGIVLAADVLGLVATSAAASFHGEDDALRVFTPDAPSRASSAAPYVSIEEWCGQADGPWTVTKATTTVFSEEPLGQDYVVPVGGETWGIWIVRREIPPLAALTFVALAFVGGRRLFAGYRSLFPWCFATLAAVACLLPDWAGAAATSALLGLTASGVVCLLVPPRPKRRSSRLNVVGGSTTDGKSNLSASRATAGVVALFILSHAAASATAQTSGAERTANVFIPVGADGKPNGDRYLVPQRLLKDLQDRIALPRGDFSEVLIQKAEYTVVVGRDLEQTRFAAAELRAVFQIFLTEAPTTITLPLGVAQATSISASLDGRVVDAKIGPGGRSLTFEAHDAGPLQLDVTLKLGAAASQSPGFTASIPRVVDSRLVISVPADMAGLVVAPAAETPQWSDSHREATVRLLPSEKLTLTWSESGAAPAQSASIDQLAWLRVRPGSIVLDVRYVVRPPAGGLKELVLSADPRLQWLPKRLQGSLVAQVDQTPIMSEQATVGQRVRVEFARPIVKEELVEISFLFTGAGGVGSLRLPDLRLADAQPGARYFAYSVDPLLAAQPPVDVGLKPLAVPDFMKIWGTDSGLPSAAYELTAETPLWTLVTRPKTPAVRAKQTTTIICGKRSADIALEAEISVADGLIYRHELQVPSGMEITSVDIAEIGDSSGGRVGRWAQDSQNRLTVFLRTPIGDRHRLTVRGTTAITPTGQIKLPLISILSAENDERVVRVGRMPDVMVSVGDLVQLERTPDEIGELAAQGARVVDSLRTVGPRPSALITVADNPSDVAARLISTYLPEGRSWRYELQVKLDVKAGALDEIALELPVQIATPLALTPSMPYEVTATNESSARQLRIRPRQAITGAFEFTLGAALAETKRDEPLPLTTMRRVAAVDHYLRLPRHAGLNPIRWETSQLAAADQFKSTGKPTPGQEFDAYRVVGSQPSAVLRSVRGAGGRPYVRIAEHRILPREDGTLVGLSSFLVEPAGADFGVLQTSTGVELLSVAAGGSVVTPEQHDGRAWMIPFASEQMPHTVDVLYRRNTSIDSTSKFEFPAFRQLHAERSLLVTFADRRAARTELRGLPTIDPLPSELERLAALDAVIADLANDGSAAAVDWSNPFVRRRAGVVARIRTQIAERADSASSRQARDLLQASDERLNTAVSATAAGADGGFDLPALWRSAYADECEQNQYVVAGDSEPVEIRFSSREPDAEWRFVYLPTACLLLIPAYWLFVRIDGFLRWPQLVGAVGAICWILFLRPTIFGWVVLAVLVGCRIYPSLRHVRERTLSLSPLPSGSRRI